MHKHIVESLSIAHRMMEHVLTLIRLQVDMLHPLTKNEEFVFLRKAVGYMHNYPGLIHHPAEEMISERLNHYIPDTAPLCLKLAEEHKQFNVLETTLLEYLNQGENGDKGACQLIKELGNTYCAEQFNHIDSEEHDMFPQAIKWLSEDDWLEIGCKSNLDMDPLSNPVILKHYDNLYDYIMSTSLNLEIH